MDRGSLAVSHERIRWQQSDVWNFAAKTMTIGGGGPFPHAANAPAFPPSLHHTRRQLLCGQYTCRWIHPLCDWPCLSPLFYNSCPEALSAHSYPPIHITDVDRALRMPCSNNGCMHLYIRAERRAPFECQITTLETTSPTSATPVLRHHEHSQYFPLTACNRDRNPL